VGNIRRCDKSYTDRTIPTIEQNPKSSFNAEIFSHVYLSIFHDARTMCMPVSITEKKKKRGPSKKKPFSLKYEKCCSLPIALASNTSPCMRMPEMQIKSPFRDPEPNYPYKSFSSITSVVCASYLPLHLSCTSLFTRQPVQQTPQQQ
jgi:hypothetical protein